MRMETETQKIPKSQARKGDIWKTRTGDTAEWLVTPVFGKKVTRHDVLINGRTPLPGDRVLVIGGILGLAMDPRESVEVWRDGKVLKPFDVESWRVD